MQLKLEGNIHLPKNLNEIIGSIPPLDKDRYSESTTFLLPHISSFKNKIDPVLLCTFFGLYKSRELPIDNFTEPSFTEKRDFNVNISEAAELLSHLLFCMWIQKNGYPGTCEEPEKYRKNLYDFISKLLDEHYYRSTIIPYYIFKASKNDGGTSSFLHRLISSSTVKLELVDYSPEYIALEFANAQREFMEGVIKPIIDKPSTIHNALKISNFLSKNENETLEFKASLRYNIHNKAPTKDGVMAADSQLEQTALEEICAFLNTEGGTVVIGVEDRTKKVLGLQKDYDTFYDEKRRNSDGFENHLRNLISNHITPYIPKLIKITFESVDEKEVCLVEIQKSSEPMYLKMKNDGKSAFWIRDGNRKKQLDGPEMVKYIKGNWVAE